METKNITDVQEIITAFLAKKLLIIPTDTIYGLACMINAKKSIKKIYELKKRGVNKPLSIIVANLVQAENLVVLSETGKKLIQQVPSITVIAPAKKIKNFNELTKDTLGVRITNAKWLHDVLLTVGPIFATSVNLTGDQPSTTLSELQKFDVDVLVYNGETGGEPSKIYDSISKKMIR